MPVPWAKGFQPPSKEAIEASIGTFPCSFDAKVRKQALGHHQKESNNNNSLEQIDIPKLFQPKQVTALSPPRDPQDWLATYVEEGDPFDDFVTNLTSRSGSFRPHAGMNRKGGIVLVPIITQQGSWPDTAPPLAELQRYLGAFFHGVSVTTPLSPAILNDSALSSTRMEWVPPDPTAAPARWVTVRRHSKPKRLQVSSDSLLSCLTDLAYDVDTDDDSRPFCVVGVTVEDLFSTESDLFVAGFAAGRSHVAVLSLCRYHPHIQMSPQHWWKYGYSPRPKSYSYFEESQTNIQLVDEVDARSNKRKRDLQLQIQPPQLLTAASHRESLRRAVKLLSHEILHVYQMGHCVYKKCLMNGTGHLVEDFAAPSHLCGSDLRKLQFRLGFDAEARYRALAEVWKSWGCIKEARWYRRREQDARKVIAEEMRAKLM